ncbi:hypothetical protein AB0B51_08695 [Streptomyces griseus]|uniref:hypothetical protein n=1 Tax=Streptomyces griseus TaxID=1911 RepID=UPI0004C5E718
MLKVTGHSDLLWLDSCVREGKGGRGRERANTLVDGFVGMLARGAIMPSGALIRFDSGEDDARWVLSPLA